LSEYRQLSNRESITLGLSAIGLLLFGIIIVVMMGASNSTRVFSTPSTRIFYFRGLDTTPMTTFTACNPTNMPNTERLAKFKYPPSTTDLRSYCFGMQGWGGAAQFEINASDLTYFTTNTKVKRFYSHVKPTASMAWFAKHMQSYLYGEHKQSEFSTYILIDTTNNDTYTVYMEFYGG
jgi:hypothetical protein